MSVDGGKAAVVRDGCLRPLLTQTGHCGMRFNQLSIALRLAHREITIFGVIAGAAIGSSQEGDSMAAGSIISCVTVFGGSGFLGAEIVRRLSVDGLVTRVATRHPENTTFPERYIQAGGIQPVYADVRDETSVALAMEGCDSVINAVGLYIEKGSETFAAVHELGALNIAHQAAVLDIDRLVHISGIGADLYSGSSYVGARGKGELLVRDAFSPATILRPSVLFGPSDKFLNTLAKITDYSPLFPLFGRGETMLQPVYVADVAEAALKVLRNPGSQGKTYELGGPRVYSYRALVELILSHTGRRRLLLPVPFTVWTILATAASILPNPPVTPPQVALMKFDNVVAKSELSLDDLSVKPTAVEDILPHYEF